MTENSAEGRNTTTTTTVLDGKNGSVHKSSAKLTKSVSEDLKTTFRSPVAWLLVAALVVTWTAVAIVMFDLVDYKSLAGGSLNKFRNEPVKVIHEVVDDTTDWLYAIFSTMSDIIALDDDQKGHVQPPVKKIVGIQPHVHKKAFQKDKEEKHEHLDVKVTTKVLHKEKPVKEEKIEKITHKIIHKEKPEAKEKPEKKLPAKVVKKEKPETHEKPGKKAPSKVSEKQKPEPKTKSEKKVPAKVTAKEKTEKKEKAEKKETPKAEKKIKISQVEEKPKKEVKAKTSEAKSTKDIKKESKAAEEKKIKLKTKETTPEKPEEKQDQYQFCRYVVDMYALGNYSTVQKEAETSRAPPRKAAATPSPSIKAEELKKKPSEKKKDALAPKKAGLK